MSTGTYRGQGRLLVVAVAGILLGMLLGPSTARAAWTQIAQHLGLVGPPEMVSANVLSEHEIEGLDTASPQAQAELLLERSINHFRGANEQIAARVNGWRGRIELNEALNRLFSVAINSNDLRVRAAGIEIDIAALDLEKTPETIAALEPVAMSGEQGPRVNALWKIALLGNRGIDPERALQILLWNIHEPNENVRYWVVEGLAHLGTDAVVAPLLDVFHDDPSPMIRERTACGLAQSGMLSEKQRRRAVPRLLDFADDGSLDVETRKWVFQALRDITGQNLPHDAAAWRDWHASTSGWRSWLSIQGPRWNPVTRDSL